MVDRFSTACTKKRHNGSIGRIIIRIEKFCLIDPRTGPDDLLEKYAAVNHKDKDNPPLLNSKSPALPTNYLPGHPFPDGHPNLRDEVSVSGVWKRRDEATIRNEIGRQYACSDNIDIQIDRVLKKLADMGELDNTYVIDRPSSRYWDRL